MPTKQSSGPAATKMRFEPAVVLALAICTQSCSSPRDGVAAAVGADASSLGDGAALPDAGPSADGGPLATLIDGVHTVLWIGGHPDDENYAAPLLYDMCNLHGASCKFLVVTDGGKGCKLAPAACGTVDDGGMPPGSIGALRHQELLDSVGYFKGTATEFAREDTGSNTVVGVAQNWNQSYSGVPNDSSIDLITQKIAQAITDSKADVIVTFDPRHGVYCQPDHRAAAALTIRAAAAMGFDLSRILMVESAELYLDASGTVTSRAWVPGDTALVRYDSSAAGTWMARSAVMGFHKSQYSADTVKFLATGVPVGAQTIAFLRVSDVVANGTVVSSPAYDAVCTSEEPYTGHGVCPKANGVGPCW